MNFSARRAGAIFALAYYPIYRKNRDSRLGCKSWAEPTGEPFSSLLGDVICGSYFSKTFVIPKYVNRVPAIILAIPL
jgi:hypothetical protein